MKATVLLYHDVVRAGQFTASGFQSPDANIYKLDEDEFGQHLQHIGQAARRKMMLVSQAADDALMITFDDGGASAIAPIAGMLEQRGWRGHFFITTDYIGKPGFLTPAELRQLRARGHIVGSHSCSHPFRIHTLSEAELDREWGESVRILEQILGEPVTVASIPGGFYGDNVVRAAARAGIRDLFTSEPVRRVEDREGCRLFGRFSIQRATPREHAAALAAGDLWPHLRQRLLWDAKKVLKAVGGPVWLEVRKRLLAKRAG